MAHGSLYMLGTYLAATVANQARGAIGFWGGVIAAAILVGLLGALIELLLLRRIYRAPELFQLLATFALVLILGDATLWLWGPEDLLGPRAPGFGGAVEVLGRHLPTYDLFLIGVGALVLVTIQVVIARTRFGRLVRAATEDREMLGALGVNQAVLFTAVFSIGALLAGLAGALEVAREPANLMMDLNVVSDAFVVVVLGGMGSIAGAYAAAVLIAEVKALCISIGTLSLAGVSFNVSKLTLVAEFLIMAAVLIVRPHGLLGRPQSVARAIAKPEEPLRRAPPAVKVFGAVIVTLLLAAPLLARDSPYLLVLGIDVLIAVLFAASLHFIMGPGGMHSFGHAAYFGLGAYGAALLFRDLAAPMPVALAAAAVAAAIGALLFGWFVVRLSGIYLAMLTLAFAQIIWSLATQWVELTGGSNGILGIWPTPPFASRSAMFLLTAILTVTCVLMLRRLLFAPFGYALRAGRDSPVRAEAIGIDVKRVRWIGFAIAGAIAGVAGGLFAFAKGSISPETIDVSRSIDGLVMVLLGGIATLNGPMVGASVFSILEDMVRRETEYWHALLGGIILLLVLVYPEGIAGGVARMLATLRRRS